MRKIICDVCGKDITDLNPCEFRLGHKINIKGGLGGITPNGHSIICQDVCDDCANSIYNYIKGLEKEC